MAAIFFVKDGSGGHHVTSDAYDVPFSSISERLSGRDLRYSPSPPRFNAQEGDSKWFAEYRYVVVETYDGESSPAFPKPGFYFVAGLTPRECSELFGLTNDG